jgi:hypothetical protein
VTELETAIADNRAAVEAFLAAARRLDAAGWTRARSEGAWTPGQIVEHVAIVYEYSRDLVLGTPPGRSFPRLLRPLLRRLVVDSTLKAGQFTRKGRAPAIFRPSPTPPEQSAAVARLSRAVTEFEGAIRSGHPEARHTVHHPYFGTLRTTDYLRLQAIHARHHQAQLT